MAAGDYLKVAAANLRRAAEARKSEADEARRNIIRAEQEAQSRVNDLGNQIKVLEAQMSRLDDDAQRALVDTQTQRLQSEIDETNRNAQTQRQQITDEASSKEGDINGLMSQASDLEKRAGQ